MLTQTLTPHLLDSCVSSSPTGLSFPEAPLSRVMDLLWCLVLVEAQ